METSFSTRDKEDGNVNNQLNSTAFTDTECSFIQPKTPKRGDVKISPILRSCEDGRRTVGRRMMMCKNRGESPLAKHPSNGHHGSIDISQFQSSTAESESGYNSQQHEFHTHSELSYKENSYPKTPRRDETSTSITNPFDSRILDLIHTSTLSPNLFEYMKSPEGKPWPIEHRAILCPANITDEDIRLSRTQHDEEFEAQVREQLDIYWKSGVGHIPSPVGPKPVTAPSPAATSVWSRPYDCPSSIRPPTSRRRVVAMRHSTAQTDCTIPPAFDFDFAQILGDQCVFRDEADPPEEEFNVSVMNTSLPRRLFTSSEECSFLTEDDSREEDLQADNSFDRRHELGSPTRNRSPFLELDLSPIRGPSPPN